MSDVFAPSDVTVPQDLSLDAVWQRICVDSDPMEMGDEADRIICQRFISAAFRAYADSPQRAFEEMYRHFVLADPDCDIWELYPPDAVEEMYVEFQCVVWACKVTTQDALQSCLDTLEVISGVDRRGHREGDPEGGVTVSEMVAELQNDQS